MNVKRLLNSSVRFEECIVYVFCDAPGYRGHCDISYGQDPSYGDIGFVPVNILSTLLLSFSSTVYYYELSHAINASVIIQFKDYFRAVKCELAWIYNGSICHVYEGCCMEIQTGPKEKDVDSRTQAQAGGKAKTTPSPKMGVVHNSTIISIDINQKMK